MSTLSTAERDIVILAMNYVIALSSTPCTQEKELLARLHEEAKAPVDTSKDSRNAGSIRRLPEVTFPDLNLPEPSFVSFYQHCNCPGCGLR